VTTTEYKEYVQDLKALRNKLIPILDMNVETGNLTSDDSLMVQAIIADTIDDAHDVFTSQEFIELASEADFDRDIDHSEPHPPTDLERAHARLQAQKENR
jgi:hypothetical protein